LLPASIGGQGEPERVWGQATTANFFDVAQLGMTLGRGFTSGEERLPVIVIGHGLWQRRFGADPAIAGKAITLSGRPFTVVGVAPPGFRGSRPHPRLPILGPARQPGSVAAQHQQLPIARLPLDHGRRAPAARRHSPQAAAELAVIARHLGQTYPEAEKDGGFRFEPAGSLPPRDRNAVVMFLAALTVVVLLVLAIACANVANLLLAQASGRQREMAVRLALGASRGHLMRQMLTESVLLALAGGLLGVVLSLWATQALSAFRFPAPVPLDLNVSVDWRVLLYTFALSAGAGILFGMAPAWAAARPMLASALKGEDVLARPGRRWTLRNVLVVSQIAMSLVLLCATGCFCAACKAPPQWTSASDRAAS
jgi:predicted permease